MRRLLAALAALGHVLPAGCGGGSGSGDGALLVFAASSLSAPLHALGDSFAAESGRRVQISFASSSLLARQIEQGAPAAVFVCADPIWIEHLAARAWVAEGTSHRIAGNRLALVVPATTRAARGEGASDRWPVLGGALPAVLSEGPVAMGDPDHVPVGRYALEALEALGWLEPIRARIVPSRDAHAALMYVALGEAASGVVYASDALGSARVSVVGVFPADLHRPVRYDAAVTASGRSDPDAARFVSYLAGEAGRAVLERHGFSVPD